MPVPGYTSAHHLASPPSAINLRYAGRFRKILLGDLGIENGELRIEIHAGRRVLNNSPFSIFHSQFLGDRG